MKTIIDKVLEIDGTKVLVSRYDGLREWISNDEFINEINRLIEDYEFRFEMAGKTMKVLRDQKQELIRQLKEVNNAYEGLDI
jgi:hypothetical protein